MHPFLLPILQLIWPLRGADRIRDRPLEILALGLSRSGTDSLRNALLELGYAEIHHGFHFILNVSEAPQWLRLHHAKATDNHSALTARDFDKALGNCMAVTDAPSCMFAPELIRAYPDAKIIINKREDVEAWYQSNLASVLRQNAGGYQYVRSYFESEIFWIQRVLQAIFMGYFRWDFAGYGKEVYRQHYDEIDRVIAEEEKAGRRRQVLRWKIEDGWKPICEFLGKEVPRRDFPSGNTPKEFEERRTKIYVKRFAVAERNMRVAGVVAVAGLAALMWWSGAGHWITLPMR